MPPDDLPVSHPAEDSTGAPATRPARGKGQPGTIGAEAEVRGGPEEPADLPIEQAETSRQVPAGLRVKP